jgi:CHAD domain-containing protein
VRTKYTLRQTFLSTWKNYEKHLEAANQRASTKNIHQLRISTQQLQAALTLMSALKPIPAVKDLAQFIKRLRKNLSSLRDIQVESITFEKLKTSDNDSRKLTRFFKQKKARTKKKALRHLSVAAKSPIRFQINQVAEGLTQIEDAQTIPKINKQLHEKLHSTALEFNVKMEKLNPASVKDIHKFRILTKKFLYQNEFLNSFATATGRKPARRSERLFEHLKTIQSVTGRIQNDSVLLKTIDQYLDKKSHHHEATPIALRRRIKLNQTQIVKNEFSKFRDFAWQN